MLRRLIASDAVTQFYDLSRFITAITLFDAVSPGLSVSLLIFLRIMTRCERVLLCVKNAVSRFFRRDLSLIH